jgi:hypothetical protein
MAEVYNISSITSLVPGEGQVLKRTGGKWEPGDITIVDLPEMQLILDELANKSDVGHNHNDLYYTETETDTLLNGKASNGHGHTTAEITGLDAALNNKAPLSHSHAQSDITGLITALSNKSAIGHTHNQSDINNLVSDLAGKANLVHVHAISEVTGLSGAIAAKADVSALDAKADLVGGVIPSAQIPALAISDFLGVVASQAAMLALSGQRGDWAKRSDEANKTYIITGEPSSLIANWTSLDTPGGGVSTVNGQSGTVTLGKADIGLGNADNTSDVNKPVSTAQQAALDAKSNTGHGHAQSEITGLVASLAGKAATSHTHAESEITNLVSDLAGKAAVSHTHIKSEVGLGNVDNTSNATERAASATLTNKTLTAPVINSPTGIVKADVGLNNVDNTSDVNKPVSTAQQAALDGKQPLDSDLTTIASLSTAANDVILQVKANTWSVRTPAQLKTDLSLTATDVGLGNVNNTSDANKPISTAEQTQLDLKAPNSSYRSILVVSASHTAAKVAGTYAMGQGDPLAVSGTGTLNPVAIIYIDPNDFPTVGALVAKLRIRAQVYTNDVAPTGNFTFGLYPVTRPATSGGAGVCIYTLGTVVTGSNGATFTAPVADSLLVATGVDFACPAAGHYVIGVVTTATIAASSHVHLIAHLQMRNG